MADPFVVKQLAALEILRDDARLVADSLLLMNIDSLTVVKELMDSERRSESRVRELAAFVPARR